MRIGKKLDLIGAFTIINPTFTLIISALSFLRLHQSIASRSNIIS